MLGIPGSGITLLLLGSADPVTAGHPSDPQIGFDVLDISCDHVHRTPAACRHDWEYPHPARGQALGSTHPQRVPAHFPHIIRAQARRFCKLL